MNLAEDQPKASVVVADLVLPIGSIAGIVGYEGGKNLVTVAQLPAGQTTPRFMSSDLEVMERWRFHILAGSPDPDRGNELNAARIAQIVSTLKSAYDFVMLDLGRSLSRISLPLIEHADLIVMVVGADMTTATLSRTVWEYLRGKGVKPASVYVILNRPVGLEGLTKAEVERILGLPIQAAMPYLAGNVSLANNQHQPYCAKFPADTASIILKEAARQIASQAKRQRGG